MFDLDTWKWLASFVDDWKSILTSIVVIGGAMVAVLRWVVRPFRRQSDTAQQTPPKVDRPLRFVQNERQSFWGPSQLGDKPGTQIVGHWQATNVSDRNVWLLQARLNGHPRTSFTNIIIQGEDGLHSRTNPVPAGQMVTVVAMLDFFPPLLSGSEPLVSEVIFTDNFEEEHRVKATFRFVHAPLVPG